MSRVCILTDTSAQFSHSTFPGKELVHIFTLPLEENLAEQSPSEARSIPPSPLDLRIKFEELASQFNEIIVLFLSSHLNQAFSIARQALEKGPLPANVTVIDSQAISAGLGWLVQYAAQIASQGLSAQEIRLCLHKQIPHIYSIFCVQNLQQLYRAGLLDPAQAIVGEMLELIPIYILENGRLAPVQKARNFRHITDIFTEFIGEFYRLKQIALIHEQMGTKHEIQSLRYRIKSQFPITPLQENITPPILEALLGKHSLSMFVMEPTV